jgi:hypothetical protein
MRTLFLECSTLYQRELFKDFLALAVVHWLPDAGQEGAAKALDRPRYQAQIWWQIPFRKSQRRLGTCALSGQLLDRPGTHHRKTYRPPPGPAQYGPKRKNPPRIAADGLPSKTIHFEQNTMVDRTGQTDFEVFIHRLCQDEGTSIRKESRRPFA